MDRVGRRNHWRGCAPADSIDGVTARTRTPLDDASQRIIAQLQEDGRRPYAMIAKAVGLSEAAVRQRVRKLVDSGVVQIVAVTDPAQGGFYLKLHQRLDDRGAR